MATPIAKYCDVCHGILGSKSYRILTSSMVNEFDEVMIEIGMTPTRERTNACTQCSYKMKRLQQYDHILKTRLDVIKKKRSELCEDLRRMHAENKRKTLEEHMITVQRPNTFAQSQVKGFRSILPASNSPILMKSNPVPVTVNFDNNLNTVPSSSSVKRRKSAKISKVNKPLIHNIRPAPVPVNLTIQNDLDSSSFEISVPVPKGQPNLESGIKKELPTQTTTTQGYHISSLETNHQPNFEPDIYVKEDITYEEDDILTPTDQLSHLAKNTLSVSPTDSRSIMLQVTERSQSKLRQSISSQTHFLLPMTLAASTAVVQPSIESTPEHSGTTEVLTQGQLVVRSNIKEGLLIPLTQGQSDTGIDIHVKEEMKVEDDDILMPKVYFSESSDNKITGQVQESNNAITFHQCAICNKIFQQYADLVDHNKIHVKEEKTDDTDEECDTVEKSNIDTLQQCNFCDKNFQSCTDLEKHLEVHVQDKALQPDGGFPKDNGQTIEEDILYKCDVCGKSFSKRRYRYNHMKIHTGGKPFKCDVCGKSFTHKYNLEAHKKIHTGEKPYKCDICGKSFTHKGSLQRHTPSHTGQKPFKCDVCGKSFTRNTILQDHMRTHTGERQFRCDVCGKSFYDNNGLKRHFRIHTGEKRYVCDVCGKAFIQSGALRVHQKTHSDLKSHECDICGTVFRMKGNLERHMKSHT
ncbi:zinc finger protein 436 [Patella vulgata]|uniref:zinc finger protein 436 n=1 Tax=Patella vulgata TaxID=6465 RepID=UPI00218003D5|nr:zinc finger protein 436 [Patella vulgata]